MHTGTGSNVTWSGDDLAEIAKWQKYMIWLVLAQILAPIFLVMEGAKLSRLSSALPAYFVMVLCIGFIVFGVYFAYNLARSVRECAAVLYALLILLPGINILVLLVLNGTATGILRGNGIRVGLKGANPADLAIKQTDATPPPRVDKLRVIAIGSIMVFLLIVTVATMNLFTDLAAEGQDAPRTSRPTINIVGHPDGQTRVITAPPQRIPVPSAPGGVPMQSQLPPGKAVVVADITITVGNKTVIRANSPRSKYAVVFEDDGETGYFYGLDRENAQNPILDTLHIYNVASVKDRSKPYPAQIAWSANGMQAVIVIDRYPHAVFDFEARRGYCRTGFPPPNQQFTRYSHAWSDDALRFFK